MTQIKYYGVDTGIPISEKHVLRVKENIGRRKSLGLMAILLVV